MQTLLNVVQDEEQAIIDECSRMISEIIDGSQGNEQKDYITLGIDEYGEPIKLFDAERLTHFACIGKSGTGKSKHAESMIEQDIDRHKAAVILLDPHGALAKDIIRRCALKSGLRKRLVSFDPSEFNAYVAGYNDLKPCFDEAPSITANRKTYDIKKVFDQSEETQVLVEQMLNNALMCLIVNGKSILDLELFFDINNTDVILEMAGKVGGPVFTFWQNYAHLPLRQKEERIAVLQRRAERFIHNPVIRQCLGEKHRVLDFRDIIENKKILVINLSTAKRKISDQDARLLGTMFLSDILAYGLTREDDKQAQDNPVHIYIDEFPWFISGNNSDLERIINGGRKYGLGLHLFCQQISQLKSDDVREAFLNANTQVVFRVGYETADVQAKNLAQFDLLTPKYIDEKVRFEPNLELRTVSNTGKSDNSGTKVSYDSDGEPLYSMNYGGSRSPRLRQRPFPLGHYGTDRLF